MFLTNDTPWTVGVVAYRREVGPPRTFPLHPRTNPLGEGTLEPKESVALHLREGFYSFKITTDDGPTLAFDRVNVERDSESPFRVLHLSAARVVADDEDRPDSKAKIVNDAWNEAVPATRAHDLGMFN